MSSYINAISTATPKYQLKQVDIAQFMAKALALDEKQMHNLEVLYRASGIKSRHSVIADYGNIENAKSFFPNNEHLEPFPTVNQRMQLYRQEALPLAIQAFDPLIAKGHLTGVTHLITVSCTGMYAPGLDLELIEALQLPYTTQRTAINFMGCYAAFNALKIADQICKANADAKVAIICLELCSIHFQKHNDPDTLLANSLFADGAAAVIVSGVKTKLSLSIEQFYCDIAPRGKQDMAWKISDFGFEMRLSSYVPDIIKTGIKQLSSNLFKKAGIDPSQVDLYAIHPGGKRILQVIEKELGLTKDDNRAAYSVLRNFGNMSSPTVLFVIKELMNQFKPEDDGKNILSFAFGPGLTLESMLLKVTADV